MNICDKCGYDHELEKFRENMKTFKFIYLIVLVMVILNALNSWSSSSNETNRKLAAIEQKLDVLMPAEVKP